MTTFAARHGITAEEIAARLGLETAQLAAFDQAGGPGWLRLALVGVAVERGVARGTLGWLLDAPAREAECARGVSDGEPGEQRV